ncbi:MAG: radical SAM family heme chaperone HemW [Spirochaetales bacterium]|nr:radical SAM family heme chaperone HemW [Spirochaetales bacterium]
MSFLFEKLIPLNEISLYIHIPYCTKKCSYCDFYSTILSTDKEIKAVLTRILDDTILLLGQMGSPGIKTLFIGGGTPSSLPSAVFKDFLSKLKQLTANSAIEFTIELNPETVTEDLLNILDKNGINRISIGIQSLDDKVLSTLGRNTNVKTSLNALEIIKEHWKGSFSADLINAVPGQTIDSALSDIKRINNYKPDHLSLYSLTFEPFTKLYNLLEEGKIETISETIDISMQEKSKELLKSLGYKQYEISNFTKEGKESLHNLNYWNMGTYLGIGPSAASTLMTSDGPVRIIYKRSISKFLESVPIEERIDFEYIQAESFLLEHLMMGFRLVSGIDIKHINNIFKMDIESFLKPLFNKWGHLLNNDKKSIYLNKEGLLLLNPFLVDVASLIDKELTVQS